MNSSIFDFNIPFLPPHRKAWLVGGAIRDLLLGNRPTDFDIISADNAPTYAWEIAQKLGTRVVELGKRPHTIYRVTDNEHTFDISSLNGSSIEEDLNQRDFCINAIAWQLPDGGLIDPTEGQKDLKNKTIRMVSAAVFKNDPVRLLRAFRMVAALNFTIDVKTFAQIRQEAPLIISSAAERIQAELFKILTTPRSAATIKLIDTAGLLQQLLPEVVQLKTCLQNRHHDFDAFNHTFSALGALDILLQHQPALDSANLKKITICTAIRHPEALKLSILLHDIGKPAARSVGPEGRIHFYGHARISAQMAEPIVHRLMLSNAMRRYLIFIIENHLYPTLLFQQHEGTGLSRRARVKFFMQAKELTPDLLLHAAADHAGKKNTMDYVASASPFLSFAQELLEDYHTRFEAARMRPPLITGRDLIQNFSLAPSALFKTILNKVEEGRLTGKLKTKADALAWTKTFLNQSGNRHNP